MAAAPTAAAWPRRRKRPGRREPGRYAPSWRLPQGGAWGKARLTVVPDAYRRIEAPTVVALEDLADDGQAQTGALAFGGVEEGGEGAVLLLHRHALTGVFEFNDHPGRGTVGHRRESGNG